MSDEIKFYIYFPGEIGAGRHAFEDHVTISVAHTFGGERSEFIDLARQMLEEWFDGASVYFIPEVCGAKHPSDPEKYVCQRDKGHGGEHCHVSRHLDNKSREWWK